MALSLEADEEKLGLSHTVSHCDHTDGFQVSRSGSAADR